MKDVVIVGGVRTPIGNFGGALKSITAHKLGELVVRALLERTGVAPDLVEEVIFGCVGQYSDAPNIARVISLFAGLPETVPGYTVQRNCSSGMQSIINAYQNIQCNDADLQIAGGTESMSLSPYVNRDLRFGKRLQSSTMIDSVWEALTDPFCNLVMGGTAENLAEEFEISREEQDRFAVESHKKSFRAIREGKFKDEIVPVSVPKKAAGRKVAPEIFSQDECPNIALNTQQLALYPAIFKDKNGTVTAGNACPLNDGASALLVMSADMAEKLKLEPLGRIRSYAAAGVAPEKMGLGPTLAIPKAVEKAGISIDDIDLFEINEAFSAQYLAVEKAIGLNREKVNVNGGAIALGHPVGMSGNRLIITLLYELKRRGLSTGCASLCIGGGQGLAMIVESI